MSWLKIAKDFRERNTINGKIRYLKEVKENYDISLSADEYLNIINKHKSL